MFRFIYYCSLYVSRQAYRGDKKVAETGLIYLNPSYLSMHILLMATNGFLMDKNIKT